MFAGSAGSADFEADAEMIRRNLTRIEQAAEQRVLSPSDRMQRPGAVECIGKSQRLRCWRAAAAAERHLEAVISLTGTDDPASDDLQSPLPHEPRDSPSHFRSDPVTMHVPP